MKLILTFANKFRKRILTLIQSLRFFLKLALIVFGVSSCVYADTIPSKVNEIALPSESTRIRFKKILFRILYKIFR